MLRGLKDYPSLAKNSTSFRCRCGDIPAFALTIFKMVNRYDLPDTNTLISTELMGNHEYS